ncbi:MAG: hypothetical protein ABW098_05950 [Candidatus Thiodiazotropha sp.]
MNDDLYENWLNDYQTRRVAFRQEIMDAGKKIFEIDSGVGLKGNWCTDEACHYSKTLRAQFENPFCLVLWSQQFDENFFLKIKEQEEIELEETRKILTWKAKNFIPRIGRLTASLDLAGYYALLLWPEGRPNPPPQPLCLEVPEKEMPAEGVSPARNMNMWFYVYAGAIELAQAIIVESNYSQVLFEELRFLHKRGLSERILYFDVNDELYRTQDDRRWPLDSIGEAVEFASAQAIEMRQPESEMEE